MHIDALIYIVCVQVVCTCVLTYIHMWRVYICVVYHHIYIYIYICCLYLHANICYVCTYTTMLGVQWISEAFMLAHSWTGHHPDCEARYDDIHSYLEPNKCMAEIFTAQKFEQLATGKVPSPKKRKNKKVQGGPQPVINGVITPINGLIVR